MSQCPVNFIICNFTFIKVQKLTLNAQFYSVWKYRKDDVVGGMLSKHSKMRKIILFKKRTEDYENTFKENNYEPVFVEPLRFIFKNESELNEKLSQSSYDGLILTSPRAIDAVAKCWDPTKRSIWHSKKIYTVGAASGLKIKDLLQLEPLGESSGNAENLANVISNENDRSTFLFPCGNLRSETIASVLPSRGIAVDCLTVYDTIEDGNLKAELAETSQCEPAPCGLVFFSPSGCEYVHRQLQTFDNKLYRLPHFAIGTSTAYRLELLGLRSCAVAAAPTPRALVDAINKYFVGVDAAQSTVTPTSIKLL